MSRKACPSKAIAPHFPVRVADNRYASFCKWLPQQRLGDPGAPPGADCGPSTRDPVCCNSGILSSPIPLPADSRPRWRSLAGDQFSMTRPAVLFARSRKRQPMGPLNEPVRNCTSSRPERNAVYVLNHAPAGYGELSEAGIRHVHSLLYWRRSGPDRCDGGMVDAVYCQGGM